MKIYTAESEAGVPQAFWRGGRGDGTVGINSTVTFSSTATSQIESLMTSAPAG